MTTNASILDADGRPRRARKIHCVDGRAGCVQLRRARENGVMVGVYYGPDAGMDSDCNEPWSTVCEEHGHIVAHDSLRLALFHSSNPTGWCETCQEIAKARENCP